MARPPIDEGEEGGGAGGGCRRYGKVEFGQSSPGEYIKREEGRGVGERWLGIGSGVYGATLLVSINFFPSSPFFSILEDFANIYLLPFSDTDSIALALTAGIGVTRLLPSHSTSVGAVPWSLARQVH